MRSRRERIARDGLSVQLTCDEAMESQLNGVVRHSCMHRLYHFLPATLWTKSLPSPSPARSLARSLAHSLTHSLLLPSKYTVSACHKRFVRVLLDAHSICYNTAAAVFCCQDSVLLLICVAACCCCQDYLLLFHAAAAVSCCCCMVLLPARQGCVHRDIAI